MGGIIMKKYFFVAFKAFNEKGEVGSGWIVVVCSCCIKRMYDAIIDYYNEHSSFENKANNVTFTALTVLDKQTAAQLSENFTNCALIIDDGEKEEKKVYIERWVARDEDGMLCVYFSENPPKKEETVWGADYDTYVEIDGSLFPEVKWSDEEPTKVKLVIDK